MKVSANTIKDIDKRQRQKLLGLLHERAVAKYAFSYAKLVRLLDELNCPDIAGELEKCVLAWTTEELKEIVDDYNDKIQAIFVSNSLKASDSGSITLLADDPFGHVKDFIYLESSSTSFKQQECIDALVTKFKLDAEQVTRIFEASKQKTPFATLQARDHKEGNGK